MGALEGIRVIDVSQYLSGPRCTQILADLGAEVIKVEPPQGEALRILMAFNPDTERGYSVINRNKKGITLNIFTEKGAEILKKLVQKADVFVENYTPGVLDRYGIGYKALSEVNPSLIYGSISGFGYTGPYSFRQAFDIIGQATGGIMDAMRRPDKPPTVFFADLVSGAYLAIGVLSALIARSKTGKGQMVDISMQDVMYFHNYRTQIRRAFGAGLTDEVMSQFGITPESLMDENRRVAFWNVYKAKDGYVVIVALMDKQWRKLMEVIGKPELGEKYAFLPDRVKNSSILIEEIQEWVGKRTVKEVVAELDRVRVPCGEVHTARTLLDDPQLKARGMLAEVEHKRFGKIGIPGIPIALTETPGKVKTPAPELGEHNEEVYSGLLGLSQSEIEVLKREGII
jgi:CoA:oxalate CoA-transferase